MPDKKSQMTRRDVMALTALAGGGVSMANSLAFAAPSQARTATASSATSYVTALGSVPAYLVLSQERWAADEIRTTLAGTVEAIGARGLNATHPVLVLLPHGETDLTKPRRESKVFAELSSIAESEGVYLAGSVPVESDAGRVVSVGFVFGSDGATLARVVKVTPDILTGFSNSTSALAQAGDFPVISTPFGKLGLLVGEDLLVPGLVRANTLNGAELLLNPAVYVNTSGKSDALEELPTTIAYENWFVVARATPSTRDSSGFPEKLATQTGVFDWQGNVARAAEGESFLQTRFDVEVVRRARAHLSSTHYDNYPVLLRDALFGAVYNHISQKRGTIEIPDNRKAWRVEAERRIAAQGQRSTPEDQLLDRYYAVATQPAPKSPLPKENRRQAQFDNIDLALNLVGGVARNPAIKLVVFPEFCFSGAGYRSVEDLLSVAVRLPGPELDVLSEFAQRTSTYVAGEFLEEDPKFPNRAFNTAFLLNDSGDLILKHRKIQCVDTLGTLRDTTPGSIFEAYVREFGIDSLYAVADTPLGKLGHIICFEGIFPEISRLLTQSGAEMIIQSTSEGWGCLRPMWHAVRRKRAFENTAYLLMSNTGFDPTRPNPWRAYGESQFIDFRGNTRDMLPYNSADVLTVLVDMAALRAARQDPHVNHAIWDEPSVYADAYNQGKGVPNELWAGDPFVFPYKDKVILKDVLARYYERGVYVRPQT
jgi:predicted amidohydrolase